MKKELLYGCLLVFAILLAPTAGIRAEQNKEKPGLYIHPKNCVTQGNEPCRLPLEIFWRLPDPFDVCLFIATQENNLACWQDAVTGSRLFDMTLDRTTLFELRRQKTDHVIYDKTFTVYRKVKRFRKKRRNPWSFY